MIRNAIVVGVDDSTSARAALEWAADYARLTDATLRAVHVSPEPALPMPYAIGVAGIPMEQRAPVEAETDARVRQIFFSVNPEPGWRLFTERGRPGEVLVEQSRDAVLLVVGTQEHTGVDRLLEGSVSHYCLRHALVPVLAYPDPEASRRRRRVCGTPREASAGVLR